MKRTKTYLARLLALLAIAAVAVAVVLIYSGFKDEKSDNTKAGAHKTAPKAQEHQPKKQRTKAKTYTIQSGDTLTAIAHKTGVPVAEIQALNPEVDPQILIAGQTLKLK
jgi:LysM repeat protein